MEVQKMRKQISLTILSLIMGIFLLNVNGCGGDKEEFQINGRVVDSVWEQGLQGVEIFIVDKQIPLDEPIAITGQDGEYTINFTIEKADSPVTTEENGVYNVTIPRIKGKETLLLKFEKKAYEDASKSVSLSLQTLNIKMIPKGPLFISVSAYKEGERSGSARNRERTPFPYLKVFYALDDEEKFDPAKYTTNDDGKLELSVPGTAKKVRLKIDDYPDDKWILQEPKVKTAHPRYGSKPEVTFIFHEARDRTIKVTCIDDKTGKSISGVNVKSNKISKRTNASSGEASLDVPALPGQIVRISCSHSKYYSARESVTIEEGQDKYPRTVRLEPTIYVTVTVKDVTDSINEQISGNEQVSGVPVSANGRRIGTTNSKGKIPRKEVRGFSQSSSIRIDDERWKISGTPQISRPKPEEKPHEYQVDVQVQFIPQTVTITTLDKESKKEITVNEAVLLDRIYKPVKSSQPTIRRGKVLIRVTHPTQKVRLSKRRYGTKTVSAKDQTVRMSRALVKVIVHVTNQKDNEVLANVKIGNEQFRSTERKEYPEGRYDVIVTSDEEDHNGIKKYMEWKGDGEEIRPNLAGNFVLFVLNVTLMDNYVGRAEAAASRGDYGTAANEYKEYVDLAEDLAGRGKFNRHSPKYIDALFKLGEIYGDKLLNCKGAIEMFEKVVELRGNDAPAYYNLGFYAYLDGKYEKAHKAFNSVIANEGKASDDNILLHTRYYNAKACYKLYESYKEDRTRREEYRNDAKDSCENFKETKPKLVQDEGEEEIRKFQKELHKIYKELTEEPLYKELDKK